MRGVRRHDVLPRLLPLWSGSVRGRSRAGPRSILRLLNLSQARSADSPHRGTPASAPYTSRRTYQVPVAHAHGRGLFLSYLWHPAVSTPAPPHSGRIRSRRPSVLWMECQRPLPRRRRPRFDRRQACVREQTSVISGLPSNKPVQPTQAAQPGRKTPAAALRPARLSAGRRGA